VWKGADAPGYFSSAEYSGGYDEVSLVLPAGADRVEVNLYYQVTSREYIEFLRDEINGTAGKRTLPDNAYIAQSDPFFTKLKHGAIPSGTCGPTTKTFPAQRPT
jgi:hypothetical protein